MKMETVSYLNVSGTDYELADKQARNNIDLKADKTALQSVASGSPAGVYESLAVLQSAEDTDKTRTYVTKDNGNWYYWNGSSWISGGVYATNIQNLEDKVNLATAVHWLTGAVVNFNTSNKTLELTATNGQIRAGGRIILYKEYENLAESLPLDLSIKDYGFISLNITNKTLVFENPDTTVPDTNLIRIGWFYWSKKTFYLPTVFTVDGDLPNIEKTFTNRMGSTAFFVFGEGLPNIDTVARTITFPTGMAVYAYNKWYGGGAITNHGAVLDISALAGIVYAERDIQTNTITLKATDYHTVSNNEIDLKNLFVLGSWWSGNNYLDFNFNFTFKVDGCLYNKAYFNLQGFKNYYAMGDSITEGVNASGQQYFTHLRKTCAIDTINSDGVGGTCITVGEGNDFLSRLSKIPSNIDLMSIFGGTNDWGHNMELGTIESTENTTFYGALKYLCKYMLENKPEITWFFITPIQRNYDKVPAEGETKGKRTNKYGKTLDEYVQAIKEIAEYYSIPVLDLYHNCFAGDANKTVELYLTDGLHPNAAGHKIMARKISKFINNVL